LQRPGVVDEDRDGYDVFISGVFFGGSPYQILKAWQSGEFELVISQDILEEYARVGEIMAEEHPKIDLSHTLRFLVEHATIYRAVELKESVCEDPDDDKFLACALASGSTIIISGDKHLLNVSGYEGIEVLKPRQFVDRYLS
jgi:putative PIN family toxin of toxin-antitoxin system